MSATASLAVLAPFHASHLSFTRFAALMALPWLVGLAIEWIVLTRAFRPELRMTSTDAPVSGDRRPLPVCLWLALQVV